MTRFRASVSVRQIKGDLSVSISARLDSTCFDSIRFKLTLFNLIRSDLGGGREKIRSLFFGFRDSQKSAKSKSFPHTPTLQKTIIVGASGGRLDPSFSVSQILKFTVFAEMLLVERKRKEIRPLFCNFGINKTWTNQYLENARKTVFFSQGKG